MKAPSGTVLAALLSRTLVAFAVALIAHGPIPAPRPDHAAFAWIPRGSFLMESPASETGRDPGEIQHPVALSGFWLARRPVTQGEWLQVMAGNPSLFRSSDRAPRARGDLV